MEKQKHYFYGHEISDYGVENGYVDYRTLASCFDCVLNNDIMQKTYDIGYWDQIQGFNETDEREIFQYYIVSDAGADILKRETNEILFYNDELDMYIWGVTHWGTSWDYVLTDIKIDW